MLKVNNKDTIIGIFTVNFEHWLLLSVEKSFFFFFMKNYFQQIKGDTYHKF